MIRKFLIIPEVQGDLKVPVLPQEQEIEVIEKSTYTSQMRHLGRL
jgi:hypothetical protein